ncbi:metal-dependent hydrolase [Vibrio astriarenae]|uniref:metal-dependent hydrolase n=1 Tax=Vibrio astriarenae TaxID=1481923 RepID=UPI0037370F52
MDPITQGLLGASLAQSVSKKQHIIVGGIIGFLSGMAPDLDVLIRSSSDPLLFLEYHRQFTHSLLFIPIGSLLCAVVLHPIIGKRWRLTFKQSSLFCLLGFGTHALLDACTSYGTQLLWPLSDERYAWNLVSVIDPLFTLLFLALVFTASLKRTPWIARVALIWAVAYPTLGLIQRERAESAAWLLAQQRQHQPVRLFTKPSFGNIVVWKSVYETNEAFYVDAIRAGRSTRIYEGEFVPKLNIEQDLAWLEKDSQQAKDITRFSRFSDGYLAQDNSDPMAIFDVRYSMIPNQIEPMWSIRLSKQQTSIEHVEYITHRNNNKESREQMLDMLLNK